MSAIVSTYRDRLEPIEALRLKTRKASVQFALWVAFIALLDLSIVISMAIYSPEKMTIAIALSFALCPFVFAALIPYQNKYEDYATAFRNGVLLPFMTQALGAKASQDDAGWYERIRKFKCVSTFTQVTHVQVHGAVERGDESLTCLDALLQVKSGPQIVFSGMIFRLATSPFLDQDFRWANPKSRWNWATILILLPVVVVVAFIVSQFDGYKMSVEDWYRFYFVILLVFAVCALIFGARGLINRWQLKHTLPGIPGRASRWLKAEDRIRFQSLLSRFRALPSGIELDAYSQVGNDHYLALRISGLDFMPPISKSCLNEDFYSGWSRLPAAANVLTDISSLLKNKTKN